jgi:Sec-independent protein translocase protein TatA
MFSIGFPELLLIFVLFILFVKPSEYKGLWRALGKITRQIKDAADAFTKNMDIK